MKKLPRLSGKEVIKIISKIGFKTIRQKGSHVFMMKETENKKVTTVVPLHDEIDRGHFIGNNQANWFDKRGIFRSC